MIGVDNAKELKDLIAKFSRAQNAEIYLPHWEHNYIRPGELIGVDKLGTRR
jgi:hypothetical protein